MPVTPRSPTIAHLKSRGLDGLFVTCSNAACQQSVSLTFASLGIDDNVQFPSIVRRRRVVYTRCGGRTVSFMPDWRKQNGSGVGR